MLNKKWIVFSISIILLGGCGESVSNIPDEPAKVVNASVSVKPQQVAVPTAPAQQPAPQIKNPDLKVGAQLSYTNATPASPEQTAVLLAGTPLEAALNKGSDDRRPQIDLAGTPFEAPLRQINAPNNQPQP